MEKNILSKSFLLEVKNIDIRSSEYPVLLKEIKDPPRKIYFRGSWNKDVFTETLSVVGSRRMTGYGEIITEKLVSEAASSGITIVSGFMYGIDASAHEASLAAGGKTIAVMPCGIERIHPGYQEKLYKRILEKGGLVISEYEGDMQPARWTFPRRNRIIAGLSPSLLVIEASIKSGALITAGYAERFGRKIFAVPGPLTSSVSLGTAGLIRKGAQIVTGLEDILEFYGKEHLDYYSETSFSGSEVKFDNTVQRVKTSSHEQKIKSTHPDQGVKSATPLIDNKSSRIITLLTEEALSIDEIARKTGLSVSETGAEITKLLLKRRIMQKKGLCYTASGGRKCL